MIRKTRIEALIKKGILALLLLAAPMPVSALHYLPEGCFGQVTENQVVVYYFTRKFRCQSCRTLENTILRTVKEHYSPSFSSGKLAMCVINVDNPANRHFLNEFEILSTSIYIVEKRGGHVIRSQNLEGMWDILDDADAIAGLLTRNLDRYLNEADKDRFGGSREGENFKNSSTDPGAAPGIGR